MEVWHDDDDYEPVHPVLKGIAAASAFVLLAAPVLAWWWLW